MKKSLTPLGETEMEVLHHVWELEEAAVKQVQARILETRDVAYTTIMTVMKNLADKGYLKYRKEGVTYVYSPAQEPESVQSSLIKDLVSKVFKGSPMELVQTLVNSEELSDEERKEIKNMIDKLED
ncbi:BlaI/MecI/CopY family transcriptional regulator [Aliifodinibius sp. S!AR15-10]|uniref:BlaI/MecI/CopY family transcriptional regulator n=1 Tax=Aliifodinibius sp. S!AR15-10 TaxID=2950437 RepID=UPI002856055C|nr:BlaI/MecI/CopY family transcriptional regulator [Aliifodinibius sp. S!AR15-10]MDR8393132.1 BlaI/MecI/CopY family transcriptional regulator [Aliifodinibius sp. S!AR15-10]